MSAPRDTFDWTDDVVIDEQAAIGVYENTAGAVVICQAGQYPNEDDLIVVAQAHVPVLAKAILRAAGYGDVELVRQCGGGYEDVETVGAARLVIRGTISDERTDGSKTKDRTAADRQRRRRDKLRDGHAPDRDDQRDSVTTETVTRDEDGCDATHFTDAIGKV